MRLNENYIIFYQIYDGVTTKIKIPCGINYGELVSHFSDFSKAIGFNANTVSQHLDLDYESIED